MTLENKLAMTLDAAAIMGLALYGQHLNKGELAPACRNSTRISLSAYDASEAMSVLAKAESCRG